MFAAHYHTCFQLQTQNVAKKAEKDVQGQQVATTKGNLNDLVRAAPQTNAQALHHFVANSPWDDDVVREQLQINLNEVLGAQAENGAFWTRADHPTTPG